MEYVGGTCCLDFSYQDTECDKQVIVNWRVQILSVFIFFCSVARTLTPANSIEVRIYSSAARYSMLILYGIGRNVQCSFLQRMAITKNVTTVEPGEMVGGLMNWGPSRSVMMFEKPWGEVLLARSFRFTAVHLCRDLSGACWFAVDTHFHAVHPHEKKVTPSSERYNAKSPVSWPT